MRFTTVIAQTGNNTGIVVPPEVLEQLGAGRRPPVRVRVGAHTYRSSVASMGGQSMISLSAANRAAAGVSGGEEVEVDVELDDQPREVEVPADLAAALSADTQAGAFFDSLSYSNRLRHVLAVEGAKAAETRSRRIDKVVTQMREGRK